MAALTNLSRTFGRNRMVASLNVGTLAFLVGASPSHADNLKKHSVASNRQVGTSLDPSRDWQPLISGRLRNGVRFAILPRKGHEPGLGLLLRNEGGFIAERRPGERGLAHLIEHVALLSPTIESPDDLYHFFHVAIPRNGRKLTFPAASAGTTSWRETNYFLSTTTTEVADLDKLLMLLRQATTDLTFRHDAVEEGRLQVIQEMAARKAGNDTYADFVSAVAPGSPNDVLDAQNSDDVLTASIDTIRQLYRRLYQPSNMMIVVVGNVDVAQTKVLIKKRFGAWHGIGLHSVRTPFPDVRYDRIAPISFSTRPQARGSAMVIGVMPTPHQPRSRYRQAERILMDALAIRAVENRLIRQQPVSDPDDVRMFIQNGEQGYRQVMLLDAFHGGRWRAAVANLQRATCYLRINGFSAAEWDVARQEVVRDLRQRAQTMDAVANVDLAKDLSHALAAGENLIPPDALLRYAERWLPTVRPQDGSVWWRRQWQVGVEQIRVESPELAGTKDPIAAIREVADQSIVNPDCVVRR